MRILLLALSLLLACEEETNRCDDLPDGSVQLYGVCLRDEQCAPGTGCYGSICQESCEYDEDCQLAEGTCDFVEQVCQYRCEDYPPEATEFADCSDVSLASSFLTITDFCDICGDPSCP